MQKHQTAREWKESLLTENEIKVLDKGLNFVPTPEKLDRLQIKNDLEKLGRDIKLRMFYQNDLYLHFLRTQRSKYHLHGLLQSEMCNLNFI